VLDFLHRISTNETKNLQKEQLTETIFTTEKGRIIDKTTLLNFDEFKLIVSSYIHQQKVLGWINKYIISDDVKAININSKYTVFELLGPQADSFLMMICGNVINNIQPNTFKIINAEGIIFFLAKLSDKNGKNKYWIIADPNHGQQFIKFILGNSSIFDFSLIGEEAYNQYRVEKGIPSAPNEINDLFNPHETKLNGLISFTKGCYIGQEVIARLDTYNKVQKYLSGVTFQDPVDDNETFNLFDDEGNEAGLITSSAYSFKFKKYFGLGYIRKPYIDEETHLTAKNDSGRSIKISVRNLPSQK
jgi:folate-binding protein YgfZ